MSGWEPYAILAAVIGALIYISVRLAKKTGSETSKRKMVQRAKKRVEKYERKRDEADRALRELTDRWLSDDAPE